MKIRTQDQITLHCWCNWERPQIGSRRITAVLHSRYIPFPDAHHALLKLQHSVWTLTYTTIEVSNYGEKGIDTAYMQRQERCEPANLMQGSRKENLRHEVAMWTRCPSRTVCVRPIPKKGRKFDVGPSTHSVRSLLSVLERMGEGSYAASSRLTSDRLESLSFWLISDRLDSLSSCAAVVRSSMVVKRRRFCSLMLLSRVSIELSVARILAN